MSVHCFRCGSWIFLGLSVAALVGGCLTLSHRLTRWKMLGQEALAHPLEAVGGDAVVFLPPGENKILNRNQLAAAVPEELIDYYAPIFIQQRIPSDEQRFPYPAEYDQIGEAHLRRGADGKLKAYVAGTPTVYAIYKILPIDGHQRVQLTYTAWYPAHPRLKAIDLEEAAIDSCVVRITLDSDNTPLFHETIAACGGYHKIFVEKWIEDRARATYGEPARDTLFCVERAARDGIDWEVAGLVDQPRNRPRRPVVFLKAGDHKVLGLGSSARLKLPATAETHLYGITSYADLYAVTVDESQETAPFFDLKDGGKVHGAQRKKERFLLTIIGVDSTGQPCADDHIKLHFNQNTWDDTTIYSRFLHLPPGVL